MQMGATPRAPDGEKAKGDGEVKCLPYELDDWPVCGRCGNGPRERKVTVQCTWINHCLCFRCWTDLHSAATEERRSGGCRLAWPLGSPAESFHRTPDTQQWKPLGALTIKMLHDMVFDGGHQAGRAALVLESRAREERGEAFAALCSLAQRSRTKALEALIQMKELPEDLREEAENQGMIQRRCENQTCECVEEPRLLHWRTKPRSFQGMVACSGLGTEPRF